MRTNLEFRSSAFLEPGGADVVHGQIIARYLADHLSDHGFSAEAVTQEDWGWRVSLVNQSFPLWIGCGHYEEYPDGVLCFIEPSRPFVRRWLKKIPTADVVERVANALEAVVRDSGMASDLRWWSVTENARG